jgi:ribosomal protein L29
MLASDLRKQSSEDLNKLIRNLVRENFDLRMAVSGGSSKVKTHRFREISRNIARIKTVLNEKSNEKVAV